MTTPTATWSAPRDWSVGETLTEPNFDTYISSNLLFLKTPTQERITAGTTTNTTSATFVDISGVTITKTTGAYKCDVIFAGSAGVSSAASAVITLLIDGTNVGNASTGITAFTLAASEGGNLSFIFPTAVLTAGSHTFKCQWKTSAGTLTLNAGWNFYIVERG